MTTTLLFDLDDTLLANQMDSFLPAYLKALGGFLSPIVDPQRMIPALMAGTDRMVANRRPDCTLREVFDEVFYPALGLERSELQALIDRFYDEIFPSLQPVTAPIPGAVEAVEQALARGYHLALVTNPLFPRQAILHRLAWAGLPADRYPFDLIVSYETMHFAKPNPSFFAEVLARLGWPDGPLIVVGDDLELDITPAQQVGLPAFWVNREGKALPEGASQPNAQGTLDDLLDWLDRTPLETLQPDYQHTSAILHTLRSTPALLDSICRELPDDNWLLRPAKTEWSPVEIVCHLRDVDQEVNLPRLRKVLNEDNPFLPGEDTDPWAEERQYICQSGPQSLQRFTARRLELLNVLEVLSEEDWQRPARHAIFSRTTIQELAEIIASHDRLHVQQLLKALPA